MEQARKEITGSPVAGFDETGFRVEGKLAWVQVAPGRRQDEHAVPVDELGVDADRVTEARLAAHVLPGQVVDRIDLPGVPTTSTGTRCTTSTAHAGS